MTPKETVQVIYDSFAAGDMEKFSSVLADDCTLVMNGMHILSGTYVGKESIMTNFMTKVGKHFPDNVSGEPVKMIAEGENVFTLMNIKGNSLDMSAGHHHVVVDGKITEFHIFDDSQKWALTLKPL